MEFLRKAVNFIPVLLIKFYRYCISPLFPPVCRFHPSCSSYGLQAFQTYNVFKAAFLTAYRILRCNPFSRGGFDPLPQPGEPMFRRTTAQCDGDHDQVAGDESSTVKADP